MSLESRMQRLERSFRSGLDRMTDAELRTLVESEVAILLAGGELTPAERERLSDPDTFCPAMIEVCARISSRPENTEP